MRYPVTQKEELRDLLKSVFKIHREAYDIRRRINELVECTEKLAQRIIQLDVKIKDDTHD